MLLLFTIIVLFSYLIGSIPFGLILTKIAGYGDVRTIGSGNIGATNVLRTGSKWLAISTLLLDAGKGALVVWLVNIYFGGGVLALLAATSVVFGHMCPIWLKGRGGKGVATALAVFAVLIWPIALAACTTWLVTFLATRISSLAAIMAMLISMALIWFTGHEYFIITISTIALAVIVRHYSNILRLLNGQESVFKKS